MTVPEHSPSGTVVGNVTRAVDADEGSNAVVYYFIAGMKHSMVVLQWWRKYSNSVLNKTTNKQTELLKI